jgi:hypothetical protein
MGVGPFRLSGEGGALSFERKPSKIPPVIMERKTFMLIVPLSCPSQRYETEKKKGHDGNFFVRRHRYKSTCHDIQNP